MSLSFRHFHLFCLAILSFSSSLTAQGQGITPPIEIPEPSAPDAPSAPAVPPVIPNSGESTTPSAVTPENSTPENVPVPPKIKADGVRVSVLGYHDFSEDRKITDMCMRPKKFRQQMQTIKDLGYTVISLEDFKLWKQGKKSVPDKSILITIDDGWKAVYTDAFPILKEFGYPFTLYLYTDYIDRGGRSLTKEMINEMKKNGATIGCHSTTHPRPSIVKSARKKGDKNYTAFLENEFGNSKTKLEKLFGDKITTYVYPGGYYAEDMNQVIEKHGYQHLFTVLSGKTTRETNNKLIPRFVIYGQDKYDYKFKNAMTFKATATHSGSTAILKKNIKYPVFPQHGATTKDRLPSIGADLSTVEDLDPETLIMRVAGFGQVPAKYDPETKKFSWKINRALRFPSCTVTVQWRKLDSKKYEPVVEWSFLIDREAAYVPKTAPSLP